MMEDGVRFDIFADLFCVLQFPVCEEFDQFVGTFRLLIEVDQCVLDFLQMVALFKKSGSNKLGDKVFIAVYFFRFGNKWLPLCIRIIQARSFHIISPVCDIFADNMFFIVDRESAGCSVRPYHSYAPCVFDRGFTVFRAWAGSRVRIAEDHSQCLVLVYITVRMTAADRL